MPPPAQRVGARVRLVLDAPPPSAPEVVVTDARRGARWRSGMIRRDGAWSVELAMPTEPTVLRYRFHLADGTVVRERRQVEGVIRAVYGRWGSRDFQIAVYREHPGPDWARDEIVYQIFPDRFARSEHRRRPTKRIVNGRPAISLAWGDPPEVPPKGRDFFGGDLRGIRERLDHLRDLGVSCVYMTPVFSSPTNHRYDAIDYTRIDRLLGDERELRRLVRDARARGIRVILDGVLNHCSPDSAYFRAAQRDKSAPTHRWFQFNRWPDGYRAWANVRHMPQFSESPEVEDFFFGPRGITRYWLGTGIAGWRLDVVPWKSTEFWRRFAAAMRSERGDAYLVSEDWTNATDRLVGDTFDATMNYRFAYAVRGFATGRLGPSELDDRLEVLRRDTPAPAFAAALNLLTSHDTARLLTICGGDRRRVLLATAVQLAYPGMPMIYYGEEAGLAGRFAEDGRRAYPWDAIDRATFRAFRRMIRARRASAVLRRGDVRTVWIDERTRTYGLVRTLADRAVVALFNGSERAVRLRVPLEHGLKRAGAWRDLLGGPAARGSRSELDVILTPLSSAWLVRPR